MYYFNKIWNVAFIVVYGRIQCIYYNATKENSQFEEFIEKSGFKITLTFFNKILNVYFIGILWRIWSVDYNATKEKWSIQRIYREMRL